MPPLARERPRHAWSPSTRSINYILPTDEKPVTYLTNPGSKPAQRNAEYREVEVTIRDARPTADALDLEREGFAFNTEGSAVSDFYDNDEIEAVYSPGG